jgi:hypothetical protein
MKLSTSLPSPGVLSHHHHTAPDIWPAGVTPAIDFRRVFGVSPDASRVALHEAGSPLIQGVTKGANVATDPHRNRSVCSGEFDMTAQPESLLGPAANCVEHDAGECDDVNIGAGECAPLISPSTH